MTILEKLKAFLSRKNNVVSYNSLTDFVEQELNIVCNQCLDDVLIDKQFKFSTTIDGWSCDIIVYLYNEIPSECDVRTPLPIKSVIIVLN